jgi:hypothetical protein
MRNAANQDSLTANTPLGILHEGNQLFRLGAVGQFLANLQDRIFALQLGSEHNSISLPEHLNFAFAKPSPLETLEIEPMKSGAIARRIAVGGNILRNH